MRYNASNEAAIGGKLEILGDFEFFTASEGAVFNGRAEELRLA
jgi:hypothetical protein